MMAVRGPCTRMEFPRSAKAWALESITFLETKSVIWHVCLKCTEEESNSVLEFCYTGIVSEPIINLPFYLIGIVDGRALLNEQSIKITAR